MKRIEEIIIHESDSAFGSATIVKSWHTMPPPMGRGWRDIGYGVVITNGYWTSEMVRDKERWEFANGAIECGRPFDTDINVESNEVEAHCYGWNNRTIGCCMIGKNGVYTIDQFLKVRELLVGYLLPRFKLKPKNVMGHYEHDPHKTCPDIYMDSFREFLDDPRVISNLMCDVTRRKHNQLNLDRR